MRRTSKYVRASSDYPDARPTNTLFEVCHTDKSGRRVTNQLYTAETVSRRLQDLLQWGCTDITVTEYKESSSNRRDSVKGSTEFESSELLGYGINYRSMHTAIHGIIWSPDETLIDNVLGICQILEDAEDEHTYDSYMSELEAYFASNELFSIDEIDYRDITKDGRYYCEDGYIEIVNPVSIDLYI
jgi:hypothetical protein